MAEFDTFYQSLDAEPAKRGKQFESFVKWFLKNDPEWSTQVDHVWLWEEYPERWGVDCGIDLVFRHRNGENWAVQAKCYASDYHITKHDVDKFLSESNRKDIDKRLLIATTDHIGKNAIQVCEAQEKTVVRYLLSDFDRAEIVYPSRYEDLQSARRKDPPNPHPHQLEAISAVAENFQNAASGQLIMACGTGKTFTTLWIKEKLASKRTLVLLPSLSLLSQTLREWTFAASQPFNVLCVCSDETVGKRGEDEPMHSVADLAFPVTSDTAEIRQFLEGDGARVIFSTYQSSPLVADAQSDQSTPAFDLVIADEAHRCTGKVTTDFSTVLDNKRIRAAKRLFATATPRTYTTSVKKAAEDRGVEVVGMDDEAVFGKVLYSLPFGEAIRRKLLTDFRVVIIGVDDPMIAAWIENRELVETDSGIENDAEYLAAQIGLLKAIKDYDLKRVISFHSRVSRAEAFSEDVHQVLNWIDEEYRPSGDLWTDFVSGAMPTDKRRQKLDHLKGLGQNERGLLTNARCLSEGVDVPSLDGVAFIDPKSSQVDIVQAVGRAIRLSSEKNYGTIVLPVFIEQGADAVSSIEASNFKPVWDVLNALKSHDEELSQQLDTIRTNLGRKSGSSVSSQDLSKITIDLPSTVDQSFGDSLRTYLVERSTDSWNFWYGLLEQYIHEKGNSNVLLSYVTPDGYRLGRWAGHQRGDKNLLSDERRGQLEGLKGWTWDPLDDLWLDGYQRLKRYAEINVTANVPYIYKDEDGYPLGTWVQTKRNAKNRLPNDQRLKLESLPNWAWDKREFNWNKGFSYLKDYSKTFGHCRVTKLFNGFNLRAWVMEQRKYKGTMSAERKLRLEALEGWSWNPHDALWGEGYEHLIRYVKAHGNSRVASSFIDEDGFGLGCWVGNQRAKWKKLPDRGLRLKLEALPGWVWNARDDLWEQGYNSLVQYSEAHGDCLVPPAYVGENGYKLRAWVNNQRTSKNKMPEERRKRLEALPGWVWSVKKKS